MRHLLRNPIGETLAACYIAAVEVRGWVGDRIDRRVTEWARETHEGWREGDE